MIWKVKSYGIVGSGGIDLTAEGYDAWISDEDNPSMQPTVEHTVLETGLSEPADAGSSRKGDRLVLRVHVKGSGKQAKYDALEMAFNVLAGEAQKLVCLDNDDEEWYVMGKVMYHTSKSFFSTITLSVADLIFRSNTETSTAWDIAASDDTVDIAVGGTVEALPIFELTIDDAKTGGFGKRKWIRTYNPNDAAVIKEMVDITNGGWNTAALVSASKMQSDGDDLRVYDGSQEIDRFITGMNGASTKVFAGPLDFQPKIEMTLSGNIAGSGSVAAVYVKNTVPMKALLTRLPNKRGILEINNECFIYTGRDVAKLRIDIETRSVRGSSIAAHSDGATIKWIEHDIWVYYQNSALTAPDVDANNEPAYDIATSTNASRVYTTFGDKAGLRPGSWKAFKTAGVESHVYTGDEGDEEADPITELGMMITNVLKSGKWTPETAALGWGFAHAGGITSVTPSAGEKKKSHASWPAIAGLQKSKDGKTFVNQVNEAAPASAGSFGSITNTGTQTLGAGYKAVRFIMQGSVSVGTTPSVEAYLEYETVTVVITNPITAAMQAEEDNYDLDCEIQNLTTEQSIFLKGEMAVGDTITINSEERTVLHSDGTNMFRAFRKDAPRVDWLPFKANTTNQLKFIDVGTAGISAVVKHTERRKR